MATEKRLIDARYLTSQMYLICEVCQTENIFIDAIIDEIDNAPDVDAVEVVWCKDCKHYRNHPNGLCYLHTEPYDNKQSFKGEAVCVEPDDFCSYGERKANET